MKTKFSGILLAACISLAAIVLAPPAAHAGLQAQIDTSTTPFAAASTNTYALYHDATGNYTNGTVLANPNSFIDCSKTAQGFGEVGGYFANSTANASNVTFAVYQSADGALWSSATNIVLAIPATTTNWVYAMFPLTSASVVGPWPMLALRSVANTNAAAITAPTNWNSSGNINLFLKAYTKSGI